MELTPYLDGLRRDLAAAAAPGGPEVARAADLLAGSLEASARLCLLEVLSDAAAEITTRLDQVTVDVQLRGRDAQLVVTETPAPQPVLAEAPEAESGDLVRISLRLPEGLKESVERLAAASGISVNAWLVRAIGRVVSSDLGSPFGPPPFGPPPFGPPSPPGPPPPPGPPRPGRLGKRFTGYAQA